MFQCIQGIGASQENWPQIPQIMGRDTQEVIQSVQFYISHQMEPLLSCKCHLRVELYLFWGFGATRGSCTKINQIMGTHTQKVIQSVQFHISHQMRSCSNVNAIWGLSVTCFRVFVELGQFVGTGSQYPDFFRNVHFFILVPRSLNLPSIMWSMKGFGWAVQDILQNNC